MKRLLLVTNLFPRPDLPRCGVFNAHFARALGDALNVERCTLNGQRSEEADRKSEPIIRNEPDLSCNGCNVQRVTPLHILVPVPEWRLWRHRRIRAWQVPEEALVNQKSESGNWKWGRGGHKILGQKSDPSAFSFQFSAFPCVHYVPVFYVPIIGRALSGWFHMRAFSRYRSLFEECDAVLGSWLYPDCVAAAAVAAEAGKPFWARLHGTDRFHLDAKGRGAACRRALDAAEGVFVNAESMRQELVERGIQAGKIHVVRNGVDRDLFRPRETVESGPYSARRATKGKLWKVESGERGRRTEVGGQKTPFLTVHTPLILWVGNLVPIKGPDVALRAFAESVGSGKWEVGSGKWEVGSGEREEGTSNPEASPGCKHIPHPTFHLQLILIGSGPMRGELEAMAKSLGVEGQVTFLGSVPHEDVAVWMNRADCLLLSSRSEGMPNVVVEALASGTPVVATDVGDVAAVVRDGENGRVVQTADQRPQTTDGSQNAAMIADLAAALADVLSRDWDVEQLRASVSEYDWRQSAEAVLTIMG
jgi:teichuronic acid biosynthesis glycosyltransferase TuaC